MPKTPLSPNLLGLDSAIIRKSEGTSSADVQERSNDDLRADRNDLRFEANKSSAEIYQTIKDLLEIPVSSQQKAGPTNSSSDHERRRESVKVPALSRGQSRYRKNVDLIPEQRKWGRRGSFGIEFNTEPVPKRRDSFEADADPVQAQRIRAKPQDPFTKKSIRERLTSQKEVSTIGLPLYKYKPLLTPRLIRLIRVLGFGNDKNHIRCTMKHYSLDSAPHFQALSYTWESPMYKTKADIDNIVGDDKYTFRGCEVDLDGSSCAISGNLFEALSWLADSKMTDLIWADAICIDQDNTDEKGSQISLMGDIYAGATNVIVWLGNESSDLYNFADSRKMLSEALAKLQSKGEGNGIATVQDPLALDFVNEIGFSSVDKWLDSWRDYFLFFRRRRWFRRAWIVQEVALARNLTFQCGADTVSWKDIYELGMLLRESGWRHNLAEGLALNPRGGIGDEADRLLEYRDQVLSGGPEDPQFSQMFKNANGATSQRELWFSYLQYMIQELRRYQSSNKKDKIYAVVGLAKRVLPPGLDDPIIPDYSLSVKDVYVSVTRLILQELPVLSCLSYVESGNRRKISDLPSWVPDYTVAIGRVPFIHLGNHAIFNASDVDPSNPCVRWFSPNGEALVRGVLVDTVLESSMPLAAMYSTFYLIRCIDMCVALAKTYKPTGQDRVEVLWRTLIADTTERPPVLHPAPDDYGNHFHDWLLLLMVRWYMQSDWQARALEAQMETLEHLIDSSTSAWVLPTRQEVEETFNLACATTSHPSQSGFILPSAQRSREKALQRLDSPHLRSSSGCYLFDRAVKGVQGDRRMFRTKDGYVGLGPENVKYGDEIWIVEGARVPFVLRGNRDRHRVVGEAYVHGIMHGELAESRTTRLCLY